MSEKQIILVSCGHLDKEITSRITEDVIKEYGFPVFYKVCTLDLGDYYNPGRRQYDANLILDAIQKKAPEGFIRLIGLMKVDLYIPILTYIFGQAALNGSIAIASLYRLRNELYGLKPDYDLLLNRFSKVVIHELGHTFGLIHCQNPVCIMRSSTYVEDIDQKGKDFCHSCREKLNIALKF
ncbi:MAG: archaemetzincin family Zn-dependent metalloprotease [Bacteroidales bacterium]